MLTFGTNSSPRQVSKPCNKMLEVMSLDSLDPQIKKDTFLHQKKKKHRTYRRAHLEEVVCISTNHQSWGSMLVFRGCGKNAFWLSSLNSKFIGCRIVVDQWNWTSHKNHDIAVEWLGKWRQQRMTGGPMSTPWKINMLNPKMRVWKIIFLLKMGDF